MMKVIFINKMTSDCHETGSCLWCPAVSVQTHSRGIVHFHHQLFFKFSVDTAVFDMVFLFGKAYDGSSAFQNLLNPVPSTIEKGCNWISSNTFICLTGPAGHLTLSCPLDTVASFRCGCSIRGDCSYWSTATWGWCRFCRILLSHLHKQCSCIICLQMSSKMWPEK